MSNSKLTDGSKKLGVWDHIVFRIIIIPALLFMFRIAWASGSSGNPITAGKVEKRGKAYLEENYPGVYEQVNTQNSGTAYQQQDGTWRINYFSRVDNNNMFSGPGKVSFDLVFDENLNLVTDGYQEYYLKGGSIYSNYSMDFYRRVYDVLREPFGGDSLRIKGNYQERLDDYDFEQSGFYEAGNSLIYTGDYLDPEKEYEANELYAKYGCADLKFYMESGGYEDYKEVVKSAAETMKQNNMHYNTMHIYMWFRDSDIIFCEGTFTMEQLNTDVETAIKDNTFVFTQAEYDRRKDAGEQQPDIQVGRFSDLFEQ